jgi:solute carrier family 35 (UDP-galactose transporter), member B1
MTEQSFMKTLISFTKVTLGVYISFVSFGYLQERITRSPYGDVKEPEYFDYPLFLVFVQCLTNSLYTLLSFYIFPSKPKKSSNGEEKKQLPSTALFAFTSFCYVAAMFTSNAALLYVSYPTQVLAKSCKPIPVLIAGLLIAKKKYPLSKYLLVLFICGGISIFTLHKPSNKNHLDHETNFFGIFLLVASLVFDALTNGFQSKMNEDKEKKPTADEMMYYMNTFAVAYLGIGLIVSQEAIPAISFCLKYREVMIDISLLAIAMCVGQIFIFQCISEFGNLATTLVTTTRKFFTIIFSVIWFGHSLTSGQWFGVAIVFIALIYDSLQSYFDHQTAHSKKDLPKEDKLEKSA